MNSFEDFRTFYRNLSSKDRETVDEFLTAMMDRRQANPLTSEQESDAALRANEASPECASREEVDDMFGQTLPH